MDPYWFVSLDPDPHWDKKLDPDLYWNQCRSTTLEKILTLIEQRIPLSFFSIVRKGRAELLHLLPCVRVPSLPPQEGERRCGTPRHCRHWWALSLNPYFIAVLWIRIRINPQLFLAAIVEFTVQILTWLQMLWIRISINPNSFWLGWIRIQEGKNDPQKWRNFKFWSAGCSLLRDEDFLLVALTSFMQTRDR
jgi:hypothetical protein